LRRYVAAVLSAPVLAALYLSYFLRRSVFVRASSAVVMGAVLGLGVVGLSRPAGTQATPTHEIVPLTNAAFQTAVQTNLAPDAAVTVSFTTPMNRHSVEASLRVEPRTQVRFAWDADGTTLTVRPLDSWATATYHTVTVDAGALAASGQPLATPARSAFVTRAATTARIVPTDIVGKRASPVTGFFLEFANPVDATSLASGLLAEPAIAGTIEQVNGESAGERFLFRPDAPLKANTIYRLRLSPGVRDATGAPLAATPAIAVRTAGAPAVIRFRPSNRSQAVDRGAILSVRFTEPMNQRLTKAAFEVTVDGHRVPGTSRFAENGTVLVFQPAKALPIGRVVVMSVHTAARSSVGIPISQGRSARFTTVGAPAPRSSSGGAKQVLPPTGGGAGGGSWRAVEEYYLGLMNCTRTGGWVTSSGRCSSPGGRSVAALWIDRGISADVSRPYARMLASRGACSHFIGGTPGDRLRRAGYTSYIWAENLGCRSGNPYRAVLGSHRFFQDEKYDGDPTDHYTNLMNPDYDRVGLGVWVAHGNVRLVVDFYHPR
jgi:hypothetical protein